MGDERALEWVVWQLPREINACRRDYLSIELSKTEHWGWRGGRNMDMVTGTVGVWARENVKLLDRTKTVLDQRASMIRASLLA